MAKHYHYFVSYNLIENKGFGFGHTEVTTKDKLSKKLLPSLHKKILEHARGNNNKISNIVILNIVPMECACDE